MLVETFKNVTEEAHVSMDVQPGNEDAGYNAHPLSTPTSGVHVPALGAWLCSSLWLAANAGPGRQW